MQKGFSGITKFITGREGAWPLLAFLNERPVKSLSAGAEKPPHHIFFARTCHKMTESYKKYDYI